MISLHLDLQSARPLYLQIVEQIETAVQNATLAEGQSLWSARKIAAHYHISYQTAERALAELARRGVVYRSVKGGTIVLPRTHAPEEQPRIRHRVIALISCWEAWGTGPTYTTAEMEVYHAAAHALSAGLWGQLSFVPGSGDVPGGFSVARLAEWCAQVKFDGALIFGNMPHRGLEWLAGKGYPLVVVDAEPTGPYPYVIHDNYGGMRACMEHLLAQGHRRIAYLRSERPYHYGVRQQAYEDALRAAGITVDPELIICVRRPRPRVHDAMALWMGMEPSRRPTAIAAGSDIMAAHVLRALQERGCRVPEDVSLTGYDDEPFAALLDPPLTTLRVVWAGMGRSAVRLLLEQWENPEGNKAEPSRVVIPTELVVRASVAAV
jgi:DNA-binding transcriptional regulator YhcF (GntR family)